MNCPACDGPLEERTFSDVRLDVCASGCGGVWFPGNQEWGAY